MNVIPMPLHRAGSSRILWATLCALALTPCAAWRADATSKVPEYYDLSDDPSNLSLIGLETIAVEQTTVSFLVVDMSRQARRGIMRTILMDCSKRTISVIKAAAFAPDSPSTPLKPDLTKLPIGDTPKAQAMYQLACVGEGGLLESRVYYDDLTTIIARFWRR